MIVQNFDLARAYIDALTGNQSESAIVDFRAIHEADKAIPAIPFRDTLANAWSSIVHYNSQGYGIFAVVAAMDGQGRELANVAYLRAHYVDLDNASAQQNYERAIASNPAPSFAVQSSPGKFHVYWPVVPYNGNDRFTLLQRKLRQVFDGDKVIIDPTRVMRLPGTINTKYSNPASAKHVPGAQPHLVTVWSLPGYGYQTPVENLEAALAGVNVIEGGGGRHDLGDPSLAAPSLDWIKYGLSQLDPNELDRGEWISLTAAVKQAGWSVASEQEVFAVWSEWCTRYAANDTGENLKQWTSIRQTEVGWPSIVRRVPALLAHQKFDGKEKTVPTGTPAGADGPPSAVPPSPGGDPTPPMPTPPVPPAPGVDCSGELLTPQEQQIWFKDCVLIERLGRIMVPTGRTMNATEFNAKYGGKKFIIDSTGKVTNEAWQAATRSTLWTVPKADHMRFVPMRQYGEMIIDDLGRPGFNIFRPAIVERMPGDVTPFLTHLARVFPVESDQRTILDFMAHNVKYPGHKIPWAPVIQSVEGVGKGIFKFAMEHAIGSSYTYFPNAKEMVESGSKFNAWMRNKLFILADEIKVDERRDMIEVLKPMISETRIEIQAKGQDQDKEDNFANWAFFTNYKDAIPVNKNARRFAIFYSVLQSEDDLIAAGMTDAYFKPLYNWLGDDQNGGHRFGAKIIADYLLNYPIERGAIPMRAPKTSSTAEALQQSRGPVEQLILHCVEDQLPGFRGGWVSVQAVQNRIRQSDVRNVSPKTIQTILEALQYRCIGRSPVPYFQEDKDNRSILYNVNRDANVSDYAAWQGYGVST